MAQITKDHIVESVASALQYISYYHPPDFIKAMSEAYTAEINPSAKDAITQILINSKMSAFGKRPLCQDTGIVVVFCEVGMQVEWAAGISSLEDMINEGVRKAYLNPDNPLRASIVNDPAGKRKNTKDNTPAVIHTRLVPGKKIHISLGAKGGGSENKSKFIMLNPNDSIVDWVLETVPKMGAGWCPPGMLGIGIGGSAEKAMLLAKESLMAPIDIHDLQKRGATTRAEELRLEIFEKVNKLGIGAQGLGGLTTVLDVKVAEYPTHAASLPVAMIPNCAATRHVHFTLDGSGVPELIPPDLSLWPDLKRDTVNAKKVNINALKKEDLGSFKPGDTLLISGTILTGRDAAHKRIADMFAKGEKLPPEADFTNKFIYYVGPVDAVRDEIVGPAGPTTATRMDKFTEMMLAKTGILGMIGKAERGPIAIEAIKKHKSIYLIAVGGAAYLVAKAIKKSKVVAFADLGMEAIYEFEVEDMPVTVAVDNTGDSVHQSGPQIWKKKIAEMVPA
jgi:fumarate hydratase class I